MPEGHTIHRAALDLTGDLAGHAVDASSPQGRFPEAERLSGQTFRGAEAIGKHLLLRFSGRLTVHIHLGLFGRFRRRRSPAKEPRPTVRLRLIGPRFTWDLSGPTACELFTPGAERALRARLGADPLASSASPELAFAALQRTRRALGAVLLDQRIFAGIGNVYRAELLFLARLHPSLPARSLTRAQFEALWRSASDLLARGVADRRIITVPHPEGARPRRGEAVHVYRRRTCRVCGGAVIAIPLGGRPIYACETCQPPPGDSDP